jgi:heptosyltransferase II
MKIVVRGTNWVGDAVMQIPALRAVRRIFPEARLTLHTRSWAEGIFRDVDFIDEILAFEPENSKIKTILAQSKILKERNFDLAVLFPNSFESALTAKFAGIPQRFGYAKEGRSFLLSDAAEIPEWKNSRHEIFYYLNLVAEVEKKFFGTTDVLEIEPKLDLQVSNERREQARRILEENGIELSKKTIALGVGSTNSRAKRWHAEGYAKLNDKLQNELKANVILLGTKHEADVSNEVFEKSLKKPIILTGKTNLAEAVAILSEVDLSVRPMKKRRDLFRRMPRLSENRSNARLVCCAIARLTIDV